MKNKANVPPYPFEIGGIIFDKPSVEIDTTIPPEEACRRISSYDSKAISKIDATSEIATLESWFTKCLNSQGIFSEAYILINCDKHLSWRKIEFHHGIASLSSFWISSTNHEILLASTNLDILLGITEEEYEYELHIVEVDFSKKINRE